MGCDIHAHLEIKYNGKWEHYAHPSISRWYELFGIMAGIRDCVQPIVDPKGFPEDASITTKLDYERWGRNAHTPSWFNEDELDELKEWLSGKYLDEKIGNPKCSDLSYNLEYSVLNKTYLFGNPLTEHRQYSDCKLPKGVTEVRLVFWFDS